jgi:hypothetical protein
MTPTGEAGADLSDTALNGLIQHSFALRVSPELRPFYAREGVPDAERLLRRLFAPSQPGGEARFELGDAGVEPVADPRRANAPRRSPLVASHETSIQPRSLPFKEEAGRPLPDHSPLRTLLDWTDDGCGKEVDRGWQGFVIAGRERSEEALQKDFLVVDRADEDGCGPRTSELICQLLAHRRSRLFGLPLARDTFNILLPRALLSPASDPSLGWFAQPALSLFYVYGRRGFRPIFSFSLFLLPCKIGPESAACGPVAGSRTMTAEEIRDSVRDQWPLATAFNRDAGDAAHGSTSQAGALTVSGPLVDYLAATAGNALRALGFDLADGSWTRVGEPEGDSLTLRSFTEATFFALVLRMTRGSAALPPRKTRQAIGDRVVTALSASRVSSVVLVDNSCKKVSGGRKKCPRPDPGALLGTASAEISKPYRVTGGATHDGDAHRIDQDFFDTDNYAIGVLPADRCVVMAGDRCAQRGFEASALLEAGWAAYMTIGAATATGMIRSVFRDIARSKRSKPDAIADLEREAMVDLHETYDLEITTEIFRNRYRLLREELGINAEYRALSDKLKALYRETSTRFDARSEQRLTLLTWAIVILSAVIAGGTLVLIFKGG